MVSEDEFIVAMMSALLFGAWTLYLLFRNRQLKKKLGFEQAIAKAVAAAPPAAPLPAPSAIREEEFAELRKRVQVLERITVDKESSLAREIEDLRGR